jgi:hypothetical protein
MQFDVKGKEIKSRREHIDIENMQIDVRDI